MVRNLEYKVDICVTLFNEEDNILHLIGEFNKHSRHNGYLGNLILIDNGSDDNTWNTLSFHENPRVVIFRLPENIGYGGGAARAICHSVHDHVGLIPANNQYDFKEVSSLVRDYCKRLNDAGGPILFKGRRVARRDPAIVRLLSFMYSTLISVLSGRLIRDANGAPKIFHKQIVLPKLAGLPKDACFDAALIIELTKSGVEIVEKPVKYLRRRHGRASWEGKKLLISLKMLISILSYRFYR